MVPRSSAATQTSPNQQSPYLDQCSPLVVDACGGRYRMERRGQTWRNPESHQRRCALSRSERPSPDSAADPDYFSIFPIVSALLNSRPTATGHFLTGEATERILRALANSWVRPATGSCLSPRRGAVVQMNGLVGVLRMPTRTRNLRLFPPLCLPRREEPSDSARRGIIRSLFFFWDSAQQMPSS